MNPTLINQKGFKSFSIKLLLSFLIFLSPLKAKDSIEWVSLVETCKKKGSEICAGNFIASASCGLTMAYVNGKSLEEANQKAHNLLRVSPDGLLSKVEDLHAATQSTNLNHSKAKSVRVLDTNNL